MILVDWLLTPFVGLCTITSCPPHLPQKKSVLILGQNTKHMNMKINKKVSVTFGWILVILKWSLSLVLFCFLRADWQARMHTKKHLGLNGIGISVWIRYANVFTLTLRKALLNSNH